MSLIEKIEEIRKKPEHIKMRYVWLCVIVCMFLIVAIWFLSIKADINEASLKNKATNQETDEIKQSGSELLNEIENQKEALQKAQSDISAAQTEQINQNN